MLACLANGVDRDDRPIELEGPARHDAEPQNLDICLLSRVENRLRLARVHRNDDARGRLPEKDFRVAANVDRRADGLAALGDANGETANAWWYPGDLGTLNPDGMLCVSGRSGDVINRGGSKVSAAVIEEIVTAQTGIKDGGACGIMGASGMTELWIGVVPKTIIDLGRLKQELETDTNFNTRVDEILILDQIPRNELGKIKRHELRDMLLAAKKLSAAHTSGESSAALTF